MPGRCRSAWRSPAGPSSSAAGDQVTITDVCGTAADLSAGNIYCVRGTYTLASHERAALPAFTTAAAGGGSPPTLQVQTAVVARGSGAFTLYLPMPTDGYPHVSFYPPGGGGDFGGVYFGTGPSVLAKWWGSK